VEATAIETAPAHSQRDRKGAENPQDVTCGTSTDGSATQDDGKDRRREL